MKQRIKIICAAVLWSLFLSSWMVQAEEMSELILEPPQVVKVTSSSYNKLTITWEPVAGAEYYALYYKGGDITSWQCVKDHITGTRFVHLSSAENPVYTGIRYTYTVEAVKGDQRTPVGVNTRSGTAYLKKVATTKVGVNTYNKLNIKWTQVPGAEGYQIYRLENGKWKSLTSVSASRSSWTHKGTANHPITPGVVYTYRVKAFRISPGKKYYGGSSSTASGKTIKHKMWATSGSHIYYYLKGRKVKGWNTVEGSTYYFSKSDGSMLKNVIAGDGTAYYYVGEDGKRVDDETMNAAVRFVRENTQDSMTVSQKLLACFNALCYKGSYERFYDKVSITKIPEYALYQFKTTRGNCYRVAAAFAYIAKALGCDARVASGAVPAVGGGFTVHGWAEVRSNGIWLISDANLARRYPRLGFYMVTGKAYPFTLRRYEYYHLSALNGRINLTLEKS